MPSGFTIEKLDHLFPYICFFYGAVMTFVLNSPLLGKLADERMPPELIATWRSHRGLAMICLCVGSLWVLQNIWLA